MTNEALAKHEALERTLTATMRQRVLDRDNWQCQACGTSGENRLQLHHVIYRSQRGRHTQDNLVTLCFRCHGDVHAGRLQILLYQYDDGHFAVFCRRLTFWRSILSCN